MNPHFLNVSNFSVICRICLALKENMACLSSDIYLMIAECTSEQELYPQDKFPQKICADCLFQLKNAYHFKQQYEISLKLLNDILTQNDQTAKISENHSNEDDSHQSNAIDIKFEEVNAPSSNFIIKQEIEESEYQNIELDEIQINDFIKTEDDDDGNLVEEINDTTINKNIETSPTTVVINRHQISDFICNICNNKFLNRVRLIKHIKTHINFKDNIDETNDEIENRGKFKCDNCPKRFSTLSTLISHCEQDHSANATKCKQCGLECVNYLQMLKHEQDHSRKYVCEHCGKIFDQLAILKAHKLSHSDKKNRLYTCSLCDQSYTTISTLKSHVKSTHATRLESWDVCTICRKLVTCIKVHYLQFHGRIKNFSNNMGIKIHACWSCDAKFASWYALKRHMIKHSVERPFICKICDKGFRFDNILEIHLRTQHCK